MSYEEFQALALKNYHCGGDAAYECWEKSDFDAYVAEVGEMTVDKALDLFNMYLNVGYGF